MRKRSWLILAALIAASIAAGLAVGGNGETNKKTFEYAIGLWGDLPYSDVQAQTGVPNLIADMKASDLEFTVHDGDLKAGNGRPGSTTPTICSNALYQQGLDYFNSLRGAAMFTPGDNDWTDCDRPSNGGFNSRERLDHEREVFFSTSSSLGQHPLNPADIAWLEQTFDEAKADGSAAIMIIGQADPGFDATDGTRGPLRNPRTLIETDGQPDGFHDFLVALRDQAIAFGKPVVNVHGDSHYFRVDKPLLDSQGRRLENFTRVETFGDNQGNGDNDVHWVKALVDPHSRDVFAFQAQIVPANRTAVPAPTG